MELEAPKLVEGYVSVIRADYKNGRILNNDNTYFDGYQPHPNEGGKIYYYIYLSYDEAKNDIRLTMLNNRDYIYIIYSHTGDEIESFRPKYVPPSPTKQNLFIRLFNKLRKS